MTRRMKANRILAIAPFQPLNEANRLDEFLVAELHSLLLRVKESLVVVFDLGSLECEQVAGITFDQVYRHMHSCYSVCQAFCTLNDKLLLDVSVLYFPFCVQPFNIPHDEVVRLFGNSKNPQRIEARFQQKSLILPTKEFNKFDLVALGGTFDHLHCGHKILLATASMLCNQRLIIGITDANLLETKRFQGQIQTFELRKQRVEAFVALFKGNHQRVECEVVKLLDAFGPTVRDCNIQCIVVSGETKAGALQINARRRELGMQELEVQVIDMLVRNEDAQPEDEIADKISSTLIREYLTKH